MNRTMKDRTLKVAKEAFRCFAHGWATGDFRPYIDMLTDEFEFSFPEGELRGHYHGKEGRERMVAKCRGHAEAGERLTLHPPHHTTDGETTVVFEFVAEGDLADGYFRGEIAIAFEVDGERISGFREYYGYSG